MPLTVSNNSAVAAASYHLGKNQQALQMSIKKLASGSRLIGNSDPGTLSVSMKLNASISRLAGAQNNLQGAVSFLEVQDGILDSAGKIVNRMNELKGLGSQDPMKSTQDIASYNNEFRDLQVQLYQMSQQTFNGVSLFAIRNHNDTTDSVFRDASTNNTVSVHTSPDGSTGSKVSLHKATMLSALTISVANVNTAVAWQDSNNNAATGTTMATFASADLSGTISLSQVSSAVFAKALENIAFLRAQGGGTMSRVTFASDNIASQKTNMQAAVGRIEDVDIAAESANLAKYSILTQAAAAMVSQANTTNDVALMLLR